MTSKFYIAASALLLASSFPLTASAHCAPVNAGSASISCEQGVRVIRQSPGALPRISLEALERSKIEQKRIAAQREAAARQARLQQQKLKLEQQRINNQSYLYRDANSPIRARRGRANGIVVVNGDR